MTSVWKLIIQIALGALAAALLALVPITHASAQSLIESFFGELDRAIRGPERPAERMPAPAAAPSHAFAEPLGELGRHLDRPVPSATRGEWNPAKAFCVRTCDGHYFPVRAHAGMSVAQACSAFCPASQTRIYSGDTIDYAVARDGSRYRELPNAYVYRRQLVAGCTCNGRDAFGLAPIDAASDPTLRPGDVIATPHGLVAFTGGKDNSVNFTPVQSYSRFPQSIRAQLSALRVTPVSPTAATPLPQQPPALRLGLGYLHSVQR